MSTLKDVEQAANALRAVGEEEHAENVHEFVQDRIGRWPTVYKTFRTIAYWSVVICLLTIGVGGAVDMALAGQYFLAMLMLVVVIALYGFLRLSELIAIHIADHTEEELSEIRVSIDNAP